VDVGVFTGVGVSVAVAVSVWVLVAVGVPASCGTNATPRNAVFVAGVAILVRVPVIVAL